MEKKSLDPRLVHVFRCQSGSDYSFDNKTRLWLRVGSDGKEDSRLLLFGSIDPDLNPVLNPAFGGFVREALCDQLNTGEIPGFVPTFRNGNVALGLRERNYDEVNRIATGLVSLQVKVHPFEVIGTSPIKMIYKEVDLQYQRPNRLQYATKVVKGFFDDLVYEVKARGTKNRVEKRMLEELENRKREN